MDLDKGKIRETCADAVFKRGRNYRDEGRIQRIERFGNVVTAAVRGTNLYDVTVDIDERAIDAQCTCPYEGPGECKHVVAVLLDIIADPPRDERDRVERVIEGVPSDDSGKSVKEYRDEIEELFDQYTQHYPVVTEAIGFSHFFALAEQYRERDCYQAAATIYRALFEGIDDNYVRLDAAYDHYRKALESALNGYVNCMLATDPSDSELEHYASALEARAMSEPRINEEQFRRALDALEDRR